jgi:L-threonylcarbamoyladenylate synthase
MTPVIDCTTEDGLAEGVAAAVEAVRRGELVVLPTDTVYGVGADAFAPDAVAAILAAKGRGREMPPPVLVPSAATVDGLATGVPAYAGDTNGTVALRMPQDDTALKLLGEIGPMAVTSANVSGQPPATTILDAAAQLGSAVSVYLDAGPAAGGLASTILDCTGEAPVILRAGAVSVSAIQQVLGDIELGN